MPRAAHDVTVEDGDRLHHAGDVLAIAGERKGMAGVVRAYDGAARRHRLENPPHLGRRDIFELHHLQARAQLPAGLRRIARGNDDADRRLVRRHDLVGSVGVHDRGAVRSQRRLEQIGGGDFRHRAGCLDRDLALDGRIDGVFDPEDIAEHGLGRLRCRNINEVERHALPAWITRNLLRCWRGRAHKPARAFNERGFAHRPIGEKGGGTRPAHAALSAAGRCGWTPRVSGERRIIDGLARR